MASEFISWLFFLNVENNIFKFQRLNNFHENATGLKTENIKGKTPVEVFRKNCRTGERDKIVGASHELMITL